MPRRIFLVLMVLLALTALAACSAGKTQIKPAQDLLAAGEKYWEKKNWEKAAEAYGKVRDYYPYHTKATFAQYRAAEALYQAKKYPESLAAFETFEELHPTDPLMPKVLFRIGLCHFEMIPSVDRDQTETEEAVKTFNRLIKRFPKSEETKKAEKYLRLAYIKLVEHEIYVARYYSRTKAYEAAIGRYKKALSYPDVGFGPLITAELADAQALAEGKKPPKTKTPPPPPEAKKGFWERLKIWE
jgi:outer membrane protein assembly factor BamD